MKWISLYWIPLDFGKTRKYMHSQKEDRKIQEKLIRPVPYYNK
jgi:hypothetical protein